MSVYLWALAGSIGVTIAEVIMRRSPESYPWPVFIFSLFMSYCIWQILRQENMVSGMITLTLATAACRVVAVLWLGEHISVGAWAGFALIVLAALIRKL